ncbi:MAG: transglycosylase SLT domain-containing protein [Bdellovibrionales bacterium]|nr:transglycosylase SLT domain-containing protein [Bdellovibrionales bacterium]
MKIIDIKIFFIVFGFGVTMWAFASPLAEPKAFEEDPSVRSRIANSVNLWSKPDYDKQESALGYKVGVFSVPPGLETRVSFWIDIYSKYNSHQGVIHDSQYPDIVYESIDFSDIEKSSLNSYQKRKKRKERIKEVKLKVKERLLKLARLSSPLGLEDEDLRLWYLFANKDEENKFRQATRGSRIRFQLGQRDIIQNGIVSSGRYVEQMEAIFREEQLPLELTRLPFVESSFNLKARSKVGASGIWQFMRSTAKRYLRLNRAVDERNDPLTATIAAARLFKYNYSVLRDWPLAVTAYNHGAAGVRRQLERHQIQSLEDLVNIRQGRFGFASANFYACFLAILEVEKNADHYFGPIVRLPKEQSVKLVLGKSVNAAHLISWFGGDRKSAMYYNPHIKSSFWKGWEFLRSKDYIRVPTDQHETVLAHLNELKNLKLEKARGVYRIRKGETLSGIARRLGVRVPALMSANGIEQAHKIQIGQQLIIPHVSE